MPILNCEVNSFSVFASFFILMTHNFPYILSSHIFNFGQKNPITVPILRFTSAMVKIWQICCYFPNQKLVFLQILHHSLVSWKVTPLHFFRSNITGKDQSANIWDFWVLTSKFTKFLSFLKQQISFISNFFYQSLVPSNITSLYFLSWIIIYLGQKQPIKVQIFEIFECLSQNLLNSSCQFWTSQFLFKFCIFLHCHNT